MHKEPRNTRTWFRYETFIYLFEFKVFRHKERETQFLTMLTVRTSSTLDSLTQQTYGTFRLGKLRKSTCFVQAQISTNWVLFSNSKILSASGHDVIHVLSGVFIVTSLIVTSAPRAHEHLHSMCAPN